MPLHSSICLYSRYKCIFCFITRRLRLFFHFILFYRYLKFSFSQKRQTTLFYRISNFILIYFVCVCVGLLFFCEISPALLSRIFVAIFKRVPQQLPKFAFHFVAVDYQLFPTPNFSRLFLSLSVSLSLLNCSSD